MSVSWKPCTPNRFRNVCRETTSHYNTKTCWLSSQFKSLALRCLSYRLTHNEPYMHNYVSCQNRPVVFRIKGLYRHTHTHKKRPVTVAAYLSRHPHCSLNVQRWRCYKYLHPYNKKKRFLFLFPPSKLFVSICVCVVKVHIKRKEKKLSQREL